MNDLQNLYEKSQTKTFRDFRVYEYGVWQKHENPGNAVN